MGFESKLSLAADLKSRQPAWNSLFFEAVFSWLWVMTDWQAQWKMNMEGKFVDLYKLPGAKRLVYRRA